MANKVLSIYVGVDAIRVAEVVYNNKMVTLANAAEIATPEKSVSDGYIDDVTAVSEAIRQAVFGRGFSTKDVIFTIASKKIASKEITIPYIKGEKKMQSVLQANSAEYFPMSNSGDYSFAFTLLEDYSDAEGHKCRVSAVACPTDLVQGYHEVARELKYKIKSIDYFGNSVLQLLAMQMTPGRVDLVLQIENDQTIVNVMRGSTLVFQRSVAFGKNSVISSLMDIKKISEKDAKTLLSREDYMEKYVTDDEYSAALEFLINGIKKAVEYYRNKVKEENLQGIKIFGEGSALAGIGGILEKELGASVEFFESLAGVTVKAQAGLKASEVLRYLPNMGAIIKPLNLSVEDERSSSSVDSALILKILKVALIASIVGMSGFVGFTIYQNVSIKKERDKVNADIATVSDIEQIKADWDEALLEYRVVGEFEYGTHNDNEKVLEFIEDLEKKMPKESYINDVDIVDGNVKLTVKSGWHEFTKNEVADVIVNVANIDIVSDFKIEEISEEYKYFIIESINEDGSYSFVVDPDSDTGEYLEYDEEDEEMVERFKGSIIFQAIQTTYEVTCHIGDPNKVKFNSEEQFYYIIDKDGNVVKTDVFGEALVEEATVTDEVTEAVTDGGDL